MDTTPKKQTVFISYITEEFELANLLHNEIKAAFPTLDVFVAGNAADCGLQSGDLFLEDIREKLQSAKVVISILSPHSIGRPWINFEAGAAWLFPGTQLIPAVHGFDRLSGLPAPFSNLHALSLLGDDGLIRLFNDINKAYEVPLPTTLPNYLDVAKRMKVFSEKAIRQCAQTALPKSVRSTIRLYQYFKSSAQYNRHSVEIKQIQTRHPNLGLSCAHFQKPNLSDVFRDLRERHALETTIVWLDEYWTPELINNNVLEDIVQLIGNDTVSQCHKDICSTIDHNYAIHHFVDLSLFFLRPKYDTLKELFNHKPPSIDKLRHWKKTNYIDNIIIYDFKTPDTCVATMLEIIKAFTGLHAVQDFVRDPINGITTKIKDSLMFLRELVGERVHSDFEAGEPIKLDEETIANVAMIREWHARMADFVEVTEQFESYLSIGNLSGTLGGWKVGVLRTDTNEVTRDIRDVMQVLCDTENQIERCMARGGLPSCSAAYESVKVDPVTRIELATFGQHFKRLIKRSSLDGFVQHFDALHEIHRRVVCAKSVESVESVIQEFQRNWKGRNSIATTKKVRSHVGRKRRVNGH